MYKTYTIGELAKILGITAETIRYYERKNIIHPQHNASSGYRYYTTWDLHMLIRARCFLGFGFSIDQTAEILTKSSLSEIDVLLASQEEELEQQVIYQMNLLKKLRQNRALMQDASDKKHDLSIRMSPAMYRINTQINYQLILSREEQAEILQMCEKVPFVFSTALFRAEDIQAGNEKFEFGIGIEEQYASFLKLDNTPHLQFHPSRQCLYMCVPSRSTKLLSYHVLEPAFACMHEHNLDLAGDIITQIVAMCRPEEEYFNWHNIWIPIV